MTLIRIECGPQSAYELLDALKIRGAKTSLKQPGKGPWLSDRFSVFSPSH